MPDAVIDPEKHLAVIFCLDGLLGRINNVHVQTWRRLLQQLSKLGIKAAFLSVNKECQRVLEDVGLKSCFDLCIDGVNIAQMHKSLGVPLNQTVLIEDTSSEREKGMFACVIGVNGADEERSQSYSVDVIVSDLSEVSVTKPNALRHIDVIEALIRRYKTIALSLDYDGTLTPIVKSPELAILSNEHRQTLNKLTQHYPVSIISGRDRENVQQLVQLNDLYYAGSHGFDIAGPNGIQIKIDIGEEFLPALDKAEKDVHEHLGTIPSILIERKKFAIAVHFRQVDEAHWFTINERVSQISKEFPSLRLVKGKMILELLPNIEWNKGKALHYLLKQMHLDNAGTLPIYIGDDVTDEDAFLALSDHGLSIAVQEVFRPTAANYTLKNSDEVYQLFERLIEIAPF